METALTNNQLEGSIPESLSIRIQYYKWNSLFLSFQISCGHSFSTLIDFTVMLEKWGYFIVIEITNGK
jgi:hypothetical protein